METKHTPGPWKAHQGWADPDLNVMMGDEHPNWCEVTGPEGEEYLSINGHFGIANARLIAAAPDLLDALTNMLACSENDNEGCIVDAQMIGRAIRVTRASLEEIQDAARAAIRKATGGN